MSDYVPSIEDLRVKLCYICREEERFDDPDADKSRQWTHPCNCTLVAHEDCLLHWIQTAPGANARKCPQCGTEYELESDNPLLLRVLEKGQQAIVWGGRGVALVGAVTFAGSTAVSMVWMLAKYGAFAAKQFVGEDAFRLLIPENPSDWPVSAWVNLPLIPITLILSRFDSTFGLWAPIHIVIDLICNSPQSLALLYHPDSSRIIGFNDGNIMTSWPPPPLFFTLFALPVGRLFYRRAYARILRKIIGSGKITASTPEELLLHLRFPVEDPAEPVFERIEEPADEEVPQAQIPVPQQAAEGAEGANAPAAQPAPRANQPPPAPPPLPPPPAQLPVAQEGEEVVADRVVITLSISRIFRRVGAALALPVISNQLGKFLLHLSRYSSPLRRFLAPRPTPPGLHGLTAASFRDVRGWRFPQGVSLWEGMKTFFSVASGTSSSHTRARDMIRLDPVWWRNTVGLGLFVFVRDAMYLMHIYLAKRELESVQVRSRNFKDVDRSTLDLKPGWNGGEASDSMQAGAGAGASAEA